jgi:hypothetical protein
VKTILQRFSDDEEAQLIAAGKIDEVLDKRTERLRADVDKQIKAANERAERRKRSPTNSVIVSWVMLSAVQRLRLARCQKHPTI